MERIQRGANVIYLRDNLQENSLNVSGIGRMVSEISIVSHRACVANSNMPQILTANELASIRALVAYVAFHTHDRSTDVARHVAQHFKIADVTRLRPDQFEEAVRYLVDLGTEGMKAD